MKLIDLIKSLNEKKVIDPHHQAAHILIHQVTTDSKVATSQSIFVAIRGFSIDGHSFLEQAIENGARVLVVETPLPETCGAVQVVVPNTRKALSILASKIFLEPSQKLTLIGITGTNCKTTISYLIEAVLKETQKKPGVIGTVNYRYLDQVFPAPNTTPDALAFQGQLSQMLKAGVTHVISEVSSHGLKLLRTDESQFDIALFTNLTQDHLDFHPDLEDYFQSKKRLFIPLLKESRKPVKKAIINVDDAYGQKLFTQISNEVPCWTFSLEKETADFYVNSKSFSHQGIRANIFTPQGGLWIQSNLIGAHNLSNILGAIAACQALGIENSKIEAGLRALKGVPGRLEKVDAGQDFLVLVDYAHTDDALKNVGQALLALKQNRIITVFGCGGDRDTKKRPLMARAAESFSDVVIVTSDNPRTEDPEKIIQDIQKGLSGQKETHIEIDRAKAIFKAIEMAKTNDIILIAGKGHEDYQILGKTKIHFDDTEIARECICLQQKTS